MYDMLWRPFITVLAAIVPTLVGYTNIGSPNCGERVNSQPTRPPTMQTGQPDHGSQVLSGFTVEVTLSEKARQKLIESKETIAATSYFIASPKRGVPLSEYRRFLSRPGPIGLGYLDVEAKPGERLRFGEIKLNQSAIAMIDEQGPQLLVNVASGRRAFRDNILWCDIYEGPLEPIQGKTIQITCKLLRE
jgi:hypothetical protein